MIENLKKNYLDKCRAAQTKGFGCFFEIIRSSLTIKASPANSKRINIEQKLIFSNYRSKIYLKISQSRAHF